MIEWLNESEDIDEYYSRYSELQNLVYYHQLYKRTKSSIRRWNCYEKYNGIDQSQVYDFYNTISSYYIYFNPLITQLLVRKLNSKLKLSEDELFNLKSSGGMSEKNLLKLCSNLDVVDSSFKKNVEKIFSYRNKYAHEQMISNILNNEKSDHSGNIKQCDDIINMLCQDVYDEEIVDIYTKLKPYKYKVEEIENRRKLENITTKKLHNLAFEHQFFDIEEAVKESEFNREDFEEFEKDSLGFTNSELVSELQNRGYNIDKLLQKNPPSESYSLENTTDKSKRSPLGHIINIKTGRFVFLEQKENSKLSVTMFISDILNHKGEIVEKPIELSIGVTVNDSNTNIKTIDLSTINSTLEEREYTINIPEDNSNRLIITLEFFSCIKSQDSISTDSRKILIVKAESLIDIINDLIYQKQLVKNDRDVLRFVQQIEIFERKIVSVYPSLSKYIPNKFASDLLESENDREINKIVNKHIDFLTRFYLYIVKDDRTQLQFN